MVNDLKGSHARRPLPPIKSSHQLSTTIENLLDENSDNSDHPTNTRNKHSGIRSPLCFHTNRSKRVPRFKLFPKRKSSFNQPTNDGNTTDNTSIFPISALPHYLTVNLKPKDYPLNTPSDNYDSESPVKVYSKTNYPFRPPYF